MNKLLQFATNAAFAFVCACLLPAMDSARECISHLREQTCQIIADYVAKDAFRDWLQFRSGRCELSRYIATLLSSRNISLRYVTYTMIRRCCRGLHTCIFAQGSRRFCAPHVKYHAYVAYFTVTKIHATCGWIYFANT